MRHHLIPSPSGAKACAWQQTSLWAIGSSGVMHAWQPSISAAFYTSASFKLFVDTGSWATWELENAKDLSNHFMALHFVLTLDGVDSPQFPDSGLSWEQFVQLLMNILGLFKLALWSQALSGIDWWHVPFLLCLESLLHLISNTEIKLAWAAHPCNYTVAVFKLLKSLLLLFTKWHFSIKSNVTFAKIVDHGPPTQTLLRLCRDVKFHPLDGDIVQLAQDWKRQAVNALGPE